MIVCVVGIIGFSVGGVGIVVVVIAGIRVIAVIIVGTVVGVSVGGLQLGWGHVENEARGVCKSIAAARLC